MNLREKAVKGVVWSAIQNWGSGLLSAVVFIVLARLLDPQAFGLVALASVFTAFVAIFQRQGFAEAIVQRANLEPGHLDTAFWINVASGVVLTGVGIGIAGPVAFLFHKAQPETVDPALLASVIRWLSLSLLIASLSNAQQAILQRRFAFKSLAIRKLAASVAGGCVGVGMALSGCGVWSLVGQGLTGSLVGVVVLWHASEWRPGFRVSKKRAVDLFSFGLNVIGIEAIGVLSLRADDLLIGRFLGSVALGYYTIAYGLLRRMTQVLTGTLSTVSFPTFSRLQHHPERMRQAFYTATQMCSVVALPTFIGMSAIAPELVRGLLGEKWAASIPVMRVLALMGILYSLFFFNGPVIMACGKPSWVLISRSVRMVANVAGFALAIYLGKGITGVATALVISGYLLSPLPLWMVHKLIDIRIRAYVGGFLAPLICSLVMVMVITGARALLNGAMSSLWLLVTLVLLGMATYSAAILLVAPAAPREALKLLRSAVSAPKGSVRPGT